MKKYTMKKVEKGRTSQTSQTSQTSIFELPESQEKLDVENENNRILSDANVDVGIKPDVKENIVEILFCSCRLSLSCCNK